MKKLIAFLFLSIAFVSNAQRTMFSGNNNHGTLRANNSGSLPVFQNGSFAFNGSTSYV
jgi:hypothetical protein